LRMPATYAGNTDFCLMSLMMGHSMSTHVATRQCLLNGNSCTCSKYTQSPYENRHNLWRVRFRSQEQRNPHIFSGSILPKSVQLVALPFQIDWIRMQPLWKKPRRRMGRFPNSSEGNFPKVSDVRPYVPRSEHSQMVWRSQRTTQQLPWGYVHMRGFLARARTVSNASKFIAWAPARPCHYCSALETRPFLRRHSCSASKTNRRSTRVARSDFPRLLLQHRENDGGFHFRVERVL
jgi:hypothetical protein